MLQLFPESFIFGEATSSHFFRETISTQQLFYRNSCFFRTTAFEQSFFRSYFFKIASFQSKNSSEQTFLENRKLFRAVTFRNNYLFGGGIVQNKDIYRRATFSKQVLLHSISIFRKATFWKKLISQKSNTPYYLLFLESCRFRVATFSKDATFYSILFKRAAFLQHTFSEELLFHSYAPFPQLHFLFICQC